MERVLGIACKTDRSRTSPSNENRTKNTIFITIHSHSFLNSRKSSCQCPGYWSCRLIILSSVAVCVSTCVKSSFAKDLLRMGSNGSPPPLGPLSDLDREGSAVAGDSLSILLPENRRVSLGRKAPSSLPFFGVFGGEMVGLGASCEGRMGCASIV